MKKTVAIIWSGNCPKGEIEVRGGTMSQLGIKAGKGTSDGMAFSFEEIRELEEKGECRLELTVENALLDIGAGASIVHVRTGEKPFSFFLRDICSDYPVYIPEYRVVVTETGDWRTYGAISAEIEGRGQLSRLKTIESGPEESFEAAAVVTRDQKCATWLGTSRDIRIFEAGFNSLTENGEGRLLHAWDWVMPRFHGLEVKLPELDGKAVRYDYFAGRGVGCAQDLVRWNEEGTLPILNARHNDDDVCYTTKMFVTNEKSPLSIGNIHGTHYLVADRYSAGQPEQTERQAALADSLLDGEINRDEETVIYIRVVAENKAKAPRYCWMRLPQPNSHVIPEFTECRTEYDGTKGFGSYRRDRVFLVASVNGKPAPQQEMAALLKPGERLEYVFKLPHRPISEARAAELSKEDFGQRLVECVRFWRDKLADAARISLPEKRIDEMAKAGLLHLDLICYGNEPGGAVAPAVGVYTPIGSESVPIVQYLESTGKNDLARRAIMYFVEKQHEDGMMRNYCGYMLETGGVLWMIGEHWRYTRDIEWIRSIRDNIIKASEFLIQWMDRNRREELRNRGYGMMDGKVADPVDPYHAFMLNGYGYIGLSRAAEVLKEIAPAEAARFEAEAAALKGDILATLEKSIADCPVVPLGDGSWCPSAPPWAENCGPLCLYADGGLWYTHCTATLRDAMLGPMYLLLQEVVPPDSLYGDFIINSFSELFYLRNVAYSQPYYSPHPYVHLKRGEVKAFLKEYYNGVSSLADRETYTFWEHFSHISPHKTHEEAWFLMRTRWMLYMEDGDTLSLLPGIPRKWLEDGKRIGIDGMMTYFGPLTLEVESHVNKGRVRVFIRVDAPPSRLPKVVRIRLPHPEESRAGTSDAGDYCRPTEILTVKDFKGSIESSLNF